MENACNFETVEHLDTADWLMARFNRKVASVVQIITWNKRARLEDFRTLATQLYSEHEIYQENPYCLSDIIQHQPYIYTENNWWNILYVLHRIDKIK